MYTFTNFRSVVVVCKNMNATDVERLVPHLSLPGCKPGGTNSSTSRSQGHRGRCIELEQQKQQLLEPHQLLEDSEAAGEATSSPGETATACRGESDLCQRFKSSRCGQSDVICQLMHKVQRYLRTHYNITTGAPAPAAKRRPRVYLSTFFLPSLYSVIYLGAEQRDHSYYVLENSGEQNLHHQNSSRCT